MYFCYVANYFRYEVFLQQMTQYLLLKAAAADRKVNVNNDFWDGKTNSSTNEINEITKTPSYLSQV